MNFMHHGLFCRVHELKCRLQLSFDDKIQKITKYFTNQISTLGGGEANELT